MSILNISCLVVVFSVLSCSDLTNSNDPLETADGEDFDTLKFELKDSSILKMPYRGKSKVIFVDSLSNNLTFKIEEKDLETENLSKYNKELGKCEPPRWTEQSKEIMLVNDSLDLTFILELRTSRDRSVSHNKKFSDKLFLWSVTYPDKEEQNSKSYDNKRVFESRHALFQCVVDKRNSTYELVWTTVDSTIILGRTFYDVLRPNKYGLENNNSIFFNFKYGILAFRDHENKYWRFSHFGN